MHRRLIALVGAIALSCGGATAPGTAVAPPSASPVATAAHPLWRDATAPSGAPQGTHWIAIDSADGHTTSAAVFPSGKPAPSAVLIYLYFNGDAQGNYGMLPRDLEFAASLAKEGFVTIAPCWQPATVSAPDVCGKGIERSGAQVVGDISAIASAARTLAGVRTDRVVVIGRVSGGTIALLAASMGGGIDAAVAISAAYGGPGSAVSQRWGTTAGEHIDGLSVPILIVHGTSDTWAPGTRIDAVRTYVKSATDKGKKVDTLYVESADEMLAFTPTYWTRDVIGRVVTFAAAR